MAEQEQDGRCWRCPAAFTIADAEAVTNRGRPLDASGQEMRRIRCPKCGAVNSAGQAADRARGVADDAVNRFEMP
jgi:DNA-directed RNA polymerase subunit RPC12/RpoP